MTVSLKLFGFTVQGIHNFSHFVNQLQCVLVCFIHWRFVKHDQHPRSLIQDSWKMRPKIYKLSSEKNLVRSFVYKTLSNWMMAWQLSSARAFFWLDDKKPSVSTKICRKRHLIPRLWKWPKSGIQVSSSAKPKEFPIIIIQWNENYDLSCDIISRFVMLVNNSPAELRTVSLVKN